MKLKRIPVAGGNRSGKRRMKSKSNKKLKMRTIYTYRSSEPLERYVIPEDAKHIVFGDDFNHPLVPGDIPRATTHITFGARFNKPIDPGVIPEGVTFIVFGDDFNQRISVQGFGQDGISIINSTVFPSTLTHLTFGKNFNQILDEGDFPIYLTHLTFGENFNSDIYPGTLPDSLTHITFGDKFNRPLLHPDANGGPPWIIFGMDIMQLTFGRDFNQDVKRGYISDTLTHLKFGYSFNRPLRELDLPDTLTHLEFGDGFEEVLDENAIPRGVKHLVLGGEWIEPYINAMRPLKNLTHLTLSDMFVTPLSPGDIPDTIRHLTFGKNYNLQIPEGVFPPRLRSVVFGDKFNQPVVIQAGVERVVFGKEFRQILDGTNIPESVTHIRLPLGYDLSLDDVPDTVISIMVGEEYIRGGLKILSVYGDGSTAGSNLMIVQERLLSDRIPESVKEVIFSVPVSSSSSYEHEIQPGDIPNSVKNITFLNRYPRPFLEGVLPTGLMKLTLRQDHNYEGSVFPNSLRQLSIGRLPTETIRYPANITSLEIGASERPLNTEDIPRTVKKLVFGISFNQPISPGVLPDGLTHLTVNHGVVGQSFGSRLTEENVPSSITHLELGMSYGYELPEDSFPNLTHLKISSPAYVGRIPRSVTHLKTASYSNIPPWITHLEFLNYVDISNVRIPSNLVSLKLPGTVNGFLTPNMFPDTLEELDLGGVVQPITRGILPKNIRILKLWSVTSVDGLPYNVEELYIPGGFNESLNGIIPNSVKELYLGDMFNTPILPGDLPHGLTKLVLGEYFDQPLLQRVLPDNLEEIHFGKYFRKPFEAYVLPPNLKRLYILDNPVRRLSSSPVRTVSGPSSNVRERIPFDSYVFARGVLPSTLSHIVTHPGLKVSNRSYIPESVTLIYPNQPNMLETSRIQIQPRGYIEINRAERPSIPARRRTMDNCPGIRKEKREAKEVDLCKATLKPLTSNSDIFRNILESLIGVCNELEMDPEPGYLSTVRSSLIANHPGSGVHTINTRNREFISAVKSRTYISGDMENIRVKYLDSEAIDAGGVRRAYFTRLMEIMKDTLFTPLKGSSQRYYISDFSDERIYGAVGHFTSSYNGVYEYKHMDMSVIKDVPYTILNGIIMAIVPEHGLETGDTIIIKSLFTETFPEGKKYEINVIDPNSIQIITDIYLEDEEGNVIEDEVSGRDMKVMFEEKTYIDVSLDNSTPLPADIGRVYMDVVSGPAVSNVYEARTMSHTRLRFKLTERLEGDARGSCVVGTIADRNSSVNIESIYNTAGILFGFAMYNNINTRIPISRYLLKCMLSDEVSDNDKMLCYLLDMSEKIDDLQVLGGYHQYDTEYLKEEVESLDDEFAAFLKSNPGASDDLVRKTAFSVLEKSFIDNAKSAFESPRLESFIHGFRTAVWDIDRFHLSATELYDLVYQADLNEERMRAFLQQVVMEKIPENGSRKKLSDDDRYHIINNIIIPMGPEYYTKILIFMSGQSSIRKYISYKFIIRSPLEESPTIKGETCFNNIFLPSVYLDKSQDTGLLIQIFKTAIDDNKFNAT